VWASFREKVRLEGREGGNGDFGHSKGKKKGEVESEKGRIGLWAKTKFSLFV